MAEVAAAPAPEAVDPIKQQVDFLFDNESRDGVQAPPAPSPAPAPAPAPVAADDDEIVNSDDFFRTNFGWESVDAGKREIEELRKLKNTPPEPLKFENPTSEKIFNALKEGKEDDIYDYLDRKRKLSAVDKMPGGDAIKLHIQQTNPHYTAQDVQDVFEERYTLPEKPDADGDETDPAYLAQVKKWQDSVDKINRRVERDAFTARGELSQLNSKLVLPDIQRVDPDAEAAKKEFEQKQTAARSTYLSTLETDASKFNGFNVEYKDEEVTIPVNYAITPEEQNNFKSKITEFDIDGYFFKRWWPEGPDGKPNITQLMGDLYLLENKEKVFQKLVNESAKKMLDHRIKLQNNINVNGSGNTNQPPLPTGDTAKTQADYLWEQA